MRAWTVKELRAVKAWSHLGAHNLALILERTPQQVRSAAALNGISVRNTGEDVEVHAEALGLADLVADCTVPVCPACGKRWARMKGTGLCRSCHLDRLLEIHQERQDEAVRLKRLDKARQDKRRMRVCERCGQPFYPRPSSPATVCQDCA